MKSEKNILIAFILNIVFSIFEFFGGILTNSVAIISDSIHDIADAISIGLSFILEKISKKNPDSKYTYGYIRYSSLGSLITTLILIIGSVIVIYNAIKRIINPVSINYNGMIIFAIFGVVLNFFAAYFTKGGHSLNQKTVNLHMIEDVLGWIVVLIGAIIMKFTDIKIIDPILSILVALFILISAIKNLKLLMDLFLEKTPKGISISKVKENLEQIDGVKNIHHIHIWSIDGYNNYATLHVLANDNSKKIKDSIKDVLKHYKINHVTIQLETLEDACEDIICKMEDNHSFHHH